MRVTRNRNLITLSSDNVINRYALVWYNNIIANGGSISYEKLLIFNNYFFVPADLNGNILNQLDRLNIYAGLNDFEIAARTNLIKNAHYITPVNSPIFNNAGYASGGTSYLNLNYTPSTDSIKLTQNSALQFSVVKNPSFSSMFRIIGSSQALGNKAVVLIRSGSPSKLSAYTNNSASTPVNNNNTVALGSVFFAGIRNGTLVSSVIDSDVQSLTITSTLLSEYSCYELTSNFQGSPVGNYDTNYHMASGHGSGVLDYTALRNILNNLFTALGV